MANSNSDAIGDRFEVLQLAPNPVIVFCMRDWLVLMAHLIVTTIRTVTPGGARAVIAESLLLPKSGGPGPSWLSAIAEARDSLWSVDLFRCESILLKSFWVMVVIDVFTRRIVGFGAEPVAYRRRQRLPHVQPRSLRPAGIACWLERQAAARIEYLKAENRCSAHSTWPTSNDLHGRGASNTR
jgi:hypothetical protein